MKEICGMLFADDKVIDMGSVKYLEEYPNHRRDYILKSIDVEKLNNINNAGEGSAAYCTDTGDLYMLHMGEWVKQE